MYQHFIVRFPSMDNLLWVQYRMMLCNIARMKARRKADYEQWQRILAEEEAMDEERWAREDDFEKGDFDQEFLLEKRVALEQLTHGWIGCDLCEARTAHDINGDCIPCKAWRL